ncbi:MAG: 30S ribosomal protein S4 [Candidatus Bathyarchaeota archaeon]|nr:30S ribosomal protein S4 [Candidatus Bathyarchaeota archaeon]MDH5595823.1 30S ribosomal protein S4 [Candidatus Bathyarchaeota archaeon]
MGDPKRQRKKYETPKFPWRIDILETELNLLGQYGLRNKRELWRHKTMLSKFRGIARSLLSMSAEERRKLEKQLIDRLRHLGVLPKAAALDDVLDLTLEDILERRLQTLVFKKGLAKSMYQARQLISHGHVAIEGKRASSPSYLVLSDEEARIDYAPTSPLSNPNHPTRESVKATVETKPTVKPKTGG